MAARLATVTTTHPPSIQVSPLVTTAVARTLRIGATEYPLVLPSVRDPRLHLAGVIITIHVLGQVALGFTVSVPQIVAAILTCALIEAGWTFYRSRQLVWPASAMLTGSGVALILRVLGTGRGDHWTWYGVHVFALVAGGSLVTKYVIRYRGVHVFNPSNVGLVAAFLVLGSERVAPLDFWWAPLDAWMVAAYVVIVVGGLVITNRLRLLATAAAFWLVLTAGLGVLAASGHCMTTGWALQPVCGTYFWWVVATSPEVLIFLFFMITDPKTIPAGPAARVVFAGAVGLVAALLIAPQTAEFGAKVGLLAGLAVMSPLRWLVDRLLPEPVAGRARGSAGDLRPLHVFARGALAGAAAVVAAVAIVVAGSPARVSAQALPAVAPPTIDIDVDPATIPPVTLDAEVAALNSDTVADGGRGLALLLVENLAVEAQAVLRGDPALLRAVDHGDRLAALEQQIARSGTAGDRVVADYTFDSLHLSVIFTEGSQGGPSLGFSATGTVDQITYDAGGAELARATAPFATTFVMRQALGDRFLIVATESP
jgi:hypothetical protein